MTIFSRIINGELPSYKIKEDDHFFSFLDINPIDRGHVLVIPKVEVDKFFDLNEDLLSKWLVFAKPIAKAIEKAFDCNRCGLTVVGLEVPHAHMHLMPINKIDDMSFDKPKLKLTDAEFKEIQKMIVDNL